MAIDDYSEAFQKEEVHLPEAFLSRMKCMLKEEYPAFLASYSQPRSYGLRLNPLKVTPEEFEEMVPFPVERIPWAQGAYFYHETDRPGRSPLYRAGLYYLQDPGAMLPALLMPLEPEDMVLDLCAAPGGKATAAGARLSGKGFLAANDISPSRAKALLRNIELFGLSNTFVSVQSPEKLASQWHGVFDKIFLDAPCSGEGMFRKEEALAKDWSPQKSLNLSEIQAGLIDNALTMLRPGGLLLYSTCTFAPEENEGVIAKALKKHPETELIPLISEEGEALLPLTKGSPSYGDGNPALYRCLRAYPHRMRAEGQFLACLRKAPEGRAESFCAALPQTSPAVVFSGRKKKRSSLSPEKASHRKTSEGLLFVKAFLDQTGITRIAGAPYESSRVEIRQEKVFYSQEKNKDLPDLTGIPFLRKGLYLGELKKNRFEPSQAFALSFRKTDPARSISLSLTDKRLPAFLAGESLILTEEEQSLPDGWYLICAEGYPLSFAKKTKATLKNKIPESWGLIPQTGRP
ncbi:MAG: RsmB/NOP family class I SAM-dependent RNA methyltransferase [Blautia sp.]|nr:RsmB/NOP family class I SAM-dependent RNA methyltransferase [Blautia sp.]